MHRRRCLSAIALAGLSGTTTRTLFAADFRRLTVAYAAGGISDQVTHALAEQWSAHGPTPVVIDHRPGDAGRIALGTLRHAPTDGHTLVLCAATALLPRPAEAASPLQLGRDLSAVSGVMLTPVLIVARPTGQASGLDGWIARARQHPGAVRWASSGPGSMGYRVMRAVERHAGVRFAPIPYTGGVRPLIDAANGEFELLSTNVGPLQRDWLAQGRLQAIAVCTSSRVPLLRQVPTLREVGGPAGEFGSLFAVFAPPGLPRAVSDGLQRSLSTVLSAAPMSALLDAIGSLPVPAGATTVQDMVARLAGASSVGGTS